MLVLEYLLIAPPNVLMAAGFKPGLFGLQRAHLIHSAGDHPIVLKIV
jgi:hypothetical protein